MKLSQILMLIGGLLMVSSFALFQTLAAVSVGTTLGSVTVEGISPFRALLFATGFVIFSAGVWLYTKNK